MGKVSGAESSRRHARTLAGRFRSGQASAKKRGIVWALTKAEYAPFLLRPCFYCGGPLSETGAALDRISNDKSIGYRVDNVLPCCGPCNYLRGDDLTVAETLAAVDAIHQRRRNAVREMFEEGIDIDGRNVFIGEIDHEQANRCLKGLIAMESISSAPITLRVNSPGGDWTACLAMYDALRASRCPIRAEVLGEASSSASVLIQVAEERIMSPHSCMVIHDGSTALEGTPRDVEEHARASKESRQTMYRIYAQRSGKPVSFWEKFCAQDQVVTAKDAVAMGLADRVWVPAKKWAV